MATTTFNPAHVGVEEAPARGLLRRIFDHMVRAREAEARRHMARAFWTYSDDSLAAIGLTRRDLARWQTGETD